MVRWIVHLHYLPFSLSLILLANNIVRRMRCVGQHILISWTRIDPTQSQWIIFDAAYSIKLLCVRVSFIVPRIWILCLRYSIGEQWAWGCRTYGCDENLLSVVLHGNICICVCVLCMSSKMCVYLQHWLHFYLCVCILIHICFESKPNAWKIIKNILFDIL